MLDRPDAPTLLRAMGETLREEVLPATRGTAQHTARIIANLCLILERELRASASDHEATRGALAGLLERDGGLDELVRELDRRLAAPREPDADFVERAAEILAEDVRRRLRIDRPGYDG